MRSSVAGSRISMRRRIRGVSLAMLTVVFALQFTSSASARPSAELEEVSHDPFTNAGYEHRSEVEPDVVSHGRTAVATYQVGRASEGGSVAIGVAASTDDGRSWSDRVLRGSAAAAGGRYQRASDPSVTYGAEGTGWLVGFLGITLTGRFQIPSRSAVLVARSQDGRSFAAPVVVARAPRDVVFDKPWVACDDHRARPYFGRCYALWDELGLRFGGPGEVVLASRHVTAVGTGPLPFEPPTRRSGSGVIPLVRPDGSVLVVYRDIQHPFHPAIAAFASLDGGSSWGGSSTISVVADLRGELPVRDPGFPSAGSAQTA